MLKTERSNSLRMRGSVGVSIQTTRLRWKDFKAMCISNMWPIGLLYRKDHIYQPAILIHWVEAAWRRSGLGVSTEVSPKTDCRWICLQDSLRDDVNMEPVKATMFMKIKNLNMSDNLLRWFHNSMGKLSKVFTDSGNVRMSGS